jgi:hypothetical protein
MVRHTAGQNASHFAGWAIPDSDSNYDIAVGIDLLPLFMKVIPATVNKMQI